MYNDEYLIYLYRQGNDWALNELLDKYRPFMLKNVLISKKELENLEYDEAECLSKCYLSFYQCIDYYCEHKEVSFSAYAYICIQYVIKNYGRRLCNPKHQNLSYESIFQDSSVLEVTDFHSNPKKVVEYKESIENLKMLSTKVKGVEKAVLLCLIAGYDVKELATVLPYDQKNITNAVYRIRKKLRNMTTESIES